MAMMIEWKNYEIDDAGLSFRINVKIRKLEERRRTIIIILLNTY